MRLRALLVAALVACFFSGISSAASFGPYAIAAPIAVDGDTVRADILIFPNLTADEAIRVRGVDTPEIEQPKCAAEKVQGLKAKTFTDDWLLANAPITVNDVKPDKFGSRVDAIVIGKNGSSLADALIKAGLGRPYNGGARQPWCTTQ